jgi:signal peptidase I
LLPRDPACTIGSVNREIEPESARNPAENDLDPGHFPLFLDEDPSGDPSSPDEAHQVEVEEMPRTKHRSGFVEALVLILIALVLALTLKTYVAEAYEIKGRSMQPTFDDGQRVVVLKSFYELHRDDIIVFTSTEDPSKDLIKRIVGLPGDEIRVEGGQVYINDAKHDEPYTRHSAEERNDPPRQRTIRPGHYYVLGDNRPDSHDSRKFESIPAANIKGKVVARWWPFDQFRSF